MVNVNPSLMWAPSNSSYKVSRLVKFKSLFLFVKINMPPKLKPHGDLPLNESVYQPKCPKTVGGEKLTLISAPDTMHSEWNTSTFLPGRWAQNEIPLLSLASLSAAVPVTTTALPLPPVLAQSITPKPGGKTQQSRKRQRTLAVDLPGILSYHAVDVPFRCHKAKVSD